MNINPAFNADVLDYVWEQDILHHIAAYPDREVRELVTLRMRYSGLSQLEIGPLERCGSVSLLCRHSPGSKADEGRRTERDWHRLFKT